MDHSVIEQHVKPTDDERMMAMLIYLVSLFTTIIGPLIIWLIKREESDFVDYHGKEYMNFFISFAIYSFVSTLLMIILIGFVLIFIVGIVYFIFTIIALIKAYIGELYRISIYICFIKYYLYNYSFFFYFIRFCSHFYCRYCLFYFYNYCTH